MSRIIKVIVCMAPIHTFQAAGAPDDIDRERAVALAASVSSRTINGADGERRLTLGDAAISITASIVVDNGAKGSR